MPKFLFTALLCLCFVGYANSKPSANDSLPVEDTRLCIPIKYYEGFYYAPCIENRFTEALNRFIRFHPELRIVFIMDDPAPDKKYKIFLTEPR